MKKALLTMIAIIFVGTVFAQVPKGEVIKGKLIVDAIKGFRSPPFPLEQPPFPKPLESPSQKLSDSLRQASLNRARRPDTTVSFKPKVERPYTPYPRLYVKPDANAIGGKQLEK